MRRSLRRTSKAPTSATTRKRKRTSTTKTEREPGGPASVTVALAFGGNLGEVEAAFRRAMAQLRLSLGPLRVASLYRSAPASPVAQPDYLNTAALAVTALPPDAILALAKGLERAAGREPGGVRFGPRPLDIDLLLYGSLQSEAPEMTLPHPRMRERRFVLQPLAEIAPDLAVPPDGATVRDLLAALPPDPGFRRVEWSGGRPELGSHA